MPLPEEVLNQFPEEIRADPTLQTFNDVGSIAKSYVEARKFIGNSVQLPAKDTPPEKFDEWASEQSKKLDSHGYRIAKRDELAPESPDKYEIKWPEGFSADPEQESGFRQIAHAAGLNSKQVQALADFEAKRSAAILDAITVTPEKAEELMKKSMGAEYEGVKENVKVALEAIKADHPWFDEWAKDAWILDRGQDGKLRRFSFSSHPNVMGLLELVGGLSKEDSSLSVGNPANGSGESIENIDSQIYDIRADAKLTREEQGRRLEPLYRKKAALLGRTGPVKS